MIFPSGESQFQWPRPKAKVVLFHNGPWGLCVSQLADCTAPSAEAHMRTYMFTNASVLSTCCVPHTILSN